MLGDLTVGTSERALSVQMQVLVCTDEAGKNRPPLPHLLPSKERDERMLLFSKL